MAGVVALSALALTKRVTQEAIQLYAEASGDHNPIHVDPVFAAKGQFGGTIAHGMLVVAYISEMMTAAFGGKWLNGGILRLKFKGPARPGDVLAIAGRREGEEAISGRLYLRYAVSCRTQAQAPVIEGQALIAEGNAEARKVE